MYPSQQKSLHGGSFHPKISEQMLIFLNLLLQGSNNA